MNIVYHLNSFSFHYYLESKLRVFTLNENFVYDFRSIYSHFII